MTEKINETNKKKVNVFTKQQFLQTRQRLNVDKDILSILLEDDKSYTIAEAEKLLEEFKNRKVK